MPGLCCQKKREHACRGGDSPVDGIRKNQKLPRILELFAGGLNLQ